MGMFLNGLVLMLALTSMMYLGSATLDSVNVLAGTNSSLNFDCKSSMISGFSSNSCDNISVSLDENMARDNIRNISTSGKNDPVSVIVTSVVNIFNGFQTWILNNTPVGFIVGMIKAPYTFLKLMGLDQIWCFGLASIWYGTMTFLLVQWLRGSDG